jgi:hypothetical protein
MKIICILLSIVLIKGIYAENNGSNLLYNNSKYELMNSSFVHLDSVISDQSQEKSVIRATIYSAVIPGSGQYYAGSIWKAVLFAGIEIAGWTTYFVFNSKGKNQDDVMRQYGDQHWDARRYWSWLYYKGGLDSYVSELPQYKNLNYDTDENEILIVYNEQVVDDLRFLESALGHTHHLPETKTQQYYEMIYKYLTQFGNAWDDANFYQTYYGNTNTMTLNMLTYRDMRNDMNNFYDTASAAANVILINHILSALDAAWTTSVYNRTLRINLRVNNKKYFDERVQMYGINISW